MKKHRGVRKRVIATGDFSRLVTNRELCKQARCYPAYLWPRSAADADFVTEHRV